MPRLVLLLLVGLLTVRCRSAEDIARDEFRARLKQDARLTTAEIQRLAGEVGRAIDRKALRMADGGITRTLESDQRDRVLAVLTDPSSVYDSGLRRAEQSILRGITGGATPLLSELDALQTLWIDVDTFHPRRYEFTYSSPGFGDVAYDLRVE